ncbi:HlyD family efflux transporter periplasmic adaptor subunit [Chitinophaga agrisoli]|uniref:HlyD family efflux transporter periplasmic adaptor subunit n=1 Tax=Chitinophaga agrisoli TaxID=2607653 RepID=A0A5B2VIJ7_9BACT|nr:HlyD family efflux transporter periplasmic adaptor subunit [Chitinophaga agrisoli]KAA2239403.1 HlyD family efflux transporter periplasmic adaptor subunit [Chitinophaga agrisoli]
MQQELDLTAVHSEEVQDIIGRAPAWVIRRGNMVVLYIVLGILAGAWLIHYPDIVQAPVNISGSNPPVKMIAPSTGRIAELTKNDGEEVKEGEIIAVIDNPANTKDILELKKIVEQLDTTSDPQHKIASLSLPPHMQVGDIQDDYAALAQAIDNYRFFTDNSYYANKINVLKSQQLDNNEIRKSIQERAALLNDQLKLEKWKDSVNLELMKDKVIAPAEYHEISKNYMGQKMNNTDNYTSLLRNQQQLDEYEKNISDLQQQYKTEGKDVLLNVRNAVKRIKGLIANWEKQYLMQSQVTGKLFFFRIWKVNQYVSYGEPVFMVVPATQQYEIRAQLPVYRAGKIKPGQKVLIKLFEYPYEEFGMLPAQVERLTSVALDSTYTVQLRLEKGLTTTRNRTIQARPEITGMADIITNDRNILERIFEGVYGKLYER